MSARNSVLFLGLVAAVAASPAAVHAQQDAGFYLGASVGRAHAKDACESTGPLVVVTACDEKDTSWKLFGGYQFNRNFALEGGYVDFGKVTASGTVLGVPVSARAEANAFELLAVGTLPLTDRFSLYGKAGLFRWDAKAEGTVLGITVRERAKDIDLTFGAGLKYHFTRNVAGRLEFQRYNNVGDEDRTGQVDINIWSIGLQVRF